MSSPVPSLKLKPNAKARVLMGHPWVFANETEGLLPPSWDGEVVECRDRSGRFLGSGIYNSRSQIVWRRISRERALLDEGFIRDALRQAIARRESVLELCDRRIRRLVWSESDDLPGVVADQFDNVVVVQIQTLAMEKRTETIAGVLDDLLHPEEIIFRNDATVRRLEGLPLGVHTRSGKPWAPRWVRMDGLEYWLDPQHGQKTGFYLDQRFQHSVVARYCSGKRVLDAFCNQGAFALHAARAGAREVLGLDSAPDAIEGARKNAERAGLRISFDAVNVFDWFNASGRSHEQPWDVIILDPPPFAKSKSALEGALRGYKEINLRAMRSLAPGGVLATYTCSHHMQDADLRRVLADAAADARRKVRVLEFSHQPADHPVLVTMPESEYLRGYIVRVD